MSLWQPKISFSTIWCRLFAKKKKTQIFKSNGLYGLSKFGFRWMCFSNQSRYFFYILFCHILWESLFFIGHNIFKNYPLIHMRWSILWNPGEFHGWQIENLKIPTPLSPLGKPKDTSFVPFTIYGFSASYQSMLYIFCCLMFI